jgi:hypothetical protein
VDKPKTKFADLTAFGASLRSLREKYRLAKISAQEFQRKIKRCSLTNCFGMCCYDGASVDAETGAAIQKLASERRSAFEAMGLDLPDRVVEQSNWNGVPGTKTVTRPFPYRSLVKDYPAHFNETACVFLLDDGRCGLQILSEQDGRNPWYYKPFTCWLQPIKLSDGAIRLYDEQSDPNILQDYDGFVIRTQCGCTEASGYPASEVLRDELEFLGRLLDRDLLAEVQQEPNEAQDEA